MTEDGTHEHSGSPDCSFEFSTGNYAYFVLVRQCLVTNAVDTKLFSSVEIAMDWCLTQWRVPHRDWQPYLFDGTVRVGWQCWMTESDLLMIHKECIISFK